MSDPLTSKRRPSTDPPGDGRRLLTVGSSTLTAASLLASLVAHAALPARLRIHWTLGIGEYYGPEFAPTSLVLALFPLLIAGGAIGGWLLVTALRDVSEPADARPYDAVAVVGTLAALLAVQVVLIVANL